MFQLNFYPHLDIYHTAFRAICIGRAIPKLPVDGYRLVYFFLTFPFELKIVRMRGSKFKKLAESFEHLRPYRWAVEPSHTFLQMTEFQTVAVRALAHKAIVDREALKTEEFKLSPNFQEHPALRSEVGSFASARRSALDALLEVIGEHGISGKEGLKARSGLMPFKYDVNDNAVLN